MSFDYPLQFVLFKALGMSTTRHHGHHHTHPTHATHEQSINEVLSFHYDAHSVKNVYSYADSKYVWVCLSQDIFPITVSKTKLSFHSDRKKITIEIIYCVLLKARNIQEYTRISKMRQLILSQLWPWKHTDIVTSIRWQQMNKQQSIHQQAFTPSK